MRANSTKIVPILTRLEAILVLIGPILIVIEVISIRSLLILTRLRAILVLIVPDLDRDRGYFNKIAPILTRLEAILVVIGAILIVLDVISTRSCRS